MNNTIDLSIYRCSYWKERLYCMAKNFNLLFSIDIQDGTVDLIDAIPQEDILSAVICGHITAQNNKLILTPHITKKIWIYDLISKHWDGIAIKESNNLYGSGGFFQTYMYQDCLFLIGGGYPAILCLNLKNYSCDYIEGPYQDMLTRHPDPDFFYFRTQGVQLDNSLFLASCLDNNILKFDLATRTYHWIKVGSDDSVFSEIAWDGSSFWLSPRLNCDIVKWDGKDKTKTLSLPSELKPSLNTYAWTTCYDGNHMIFPCVSHPKSIKINIQKDSYEIFDQQYILYTRLDNGMIVSQTTDGNLSVQNGESVQTYKLTVDTDQLNEFYEKKNLPVYKGQTLYHEGAKNSISSLESFLALTKAASERRPAAEGPIGKAIWEAIR